MHFCITKAKGIKSSSHLWADSIKLNNCFNEAVIIIIIVQYSVVLYLLKVCVTTDSQTELLTVVSIKMQLLVCSSLGTGNMFKRRSGQKASPYIFHTYSILRVTEFLIPGVSLDLQFSMFNLFSVFSGLY